MRTSTNVLFFACVSNHPKTSSSWCIQIAHPFHWPAMEPVDYHSQRNRLNFPFIKCAVLLLWTASYGNVSILIVWITIVLCAPANAWAIQKMATTTTTTVIVIKKKFSLSPSPAHLLQRMSSNESQLINSIIIST